jgi:hypothetical protein
MTHAVLRGKLLTLRAHIKKQSERSQVNELMMHIKLLKKQVQN